jgi:protoporphyrinogen oxidase
MWHASEDELIRLASQEMRATGLIGQAAITEGKVIRVPRCYPVYRTGYKAHLAKVESYLREFSGLTPIGRYGSFTYNNQDHSILMGMLAAENLLESRANSLWGVNTDYESYQESARITATGLEPVGAA